MNFHDLCNVHQVFCQSFVKNRNLLCGNSCVIGYSDNVVYPSVVRKQITQAENRFTTYLLLIYFIKAMFFSYITLSEVWLFHLIDQRESEVFDSL